MREITRSFAAAAQEGSKMGGQGRYRITIPKKILYRRSKKIMEAAKENLAIY